MRGVKLSSVMLLIALIAACLLSVPAFSGEHPWDSDSSGGSSTNSSASSNERAAIQTTGSSSLAGRGGAVGGRNESMGHGRVVRSMTPMSIFFRVTYMAAEKLHAKMYGAGTMSAMQARPAGH